MPDKMTGQFNEIYSGDGISFGEAGGKYYLILDAKPYRISDHRYEPYLYIECPDNTMVVIHNSFTVDEICRAVRDCRPIMMITGNEYDAAGVFKLISKAIDLAMENVDISYVEGRCFMDYLEEHGAVSMETAVDLAEAGMQHPMMSPFIHSKKVGKTPDGLYYLIRPANPDAERFGRVISNNVRFGYGYRPFEGRRQYYAWHGYPNRNDDFFTTAEITEKEFRQIGIEYPGEISADRETAEKFRSKYVDGHPVIFEGWNRTI